MATDPVPVLDDEIERLIDVYEVASRVGVSPSTIWRMVKDDQFVRPVALGKLTRWRVRDFNAWIAARPSARPATRLRRKG
jgi:predicted DNA-binding transcriptional regulator AlpA